MYLCKEGQSNISDELISKSQFYVQYQTFPQNLGLYEKVNISPALNLEFFDPDS